MPAVAPILGAIGSAIAIGKSIGTATGSDRESNAWGRYRSSPMDPRRFAGERGIFAKEAVSPLTDPWGTPLQEKMYGWGGDALTGSPESIAAQKQAQEALNMLRPDGTSISEMMGQQEAARLGRQGLAMAKSSPGGYDPALFRAAQYSTADAQARLSGQTALNAAQEQLLRQQAYQKAASGMYGQALGAEAQRSALAAQYRKMGFDVSEANRRAWQQLNQQRLGMHMGQFQQELGQKRYEQQREDKAWDRMASTIGSMGQTFGSLGKGKTDASG